MSTEAAALGISVAALCAREDARHSAERAERLKAYAAMQGISVDEYVSRACAERVARSHAQAAAVGISEAEFLDAASDAVRQHRRLRLASVC